MARIKKYSGENFLKELEALIKKYDRCSKEDIGESLGRFIYTNPISWNNIMGGYECQCLDGFSDCETPQIKPTKVIVKAKKNKKITNLSFDKKPKKKVGRPKKIKKD